MILDSLVVVAVYLAGEIEPKLITTSTEETACAIVERVHDQHGHAAAYLLEPTGDIVVWLKKTPIECDKMPKPKEPAK